MIHIPRIIDELISDVQLGPNDIRVWRKVMPYLDLVEFRPLKLETIAGEVELDRGTVHRSLGQLVERGFLQRGPREGQHGSNTYRLPLARVYPREALRAA